MERLDIPGPDNALTDVAGLLVGHAEDPVLKSGVTVVTAEAPYTAAVHVMGGAPGTRETDLLAPDKTVTQVDALVLSGGSAFGLAACDGVAAGLRAAGRGFAVGDQHVPIVPGAILFDLINGGKKDWDENPYPALGRRALNAAGRDARCGSIGAGAGCTTASFKGGLGTASLRLENGVTVAALVAVNALGTAVVGEGPHFWAAPWEIGNEFGGHGAATNYAHPPLTKFSGQGQNTTIAIVATDADLDQAECQRMAIAAHDGMARALVPSHTPHDGDLVFAVATGARQMPRSLGATLMIGHAGAVCLSRAIARGVYAATAEPGDVQPTYGSTHGAT